MPFELNGSIIISQVVDSPCDRHLGKREKRKKWEVVIDLLSRLHWHTVCLLFENVCTMFFNLN